MLPVCRTQDMSLLLARDKRTRTGTLKTMAGSLFTVRATHNKGTNIYDTQFDLQIP